MARKRKPDAKEAALAQTRTLNPRPEAVRDEQFASAEFFDARDLVQVKYEMVRRVRVDGAPVTPDRGRRSGSPGRRTTRPPPRWTATGWAGWCRPSRARGARTSSPTRSSATPGSCVKPIPASGRRGWLRRSPPSSRSGCTRDRWSGRWPALKTPKVEAGNDLDDTGGDGSDVVDGYEQLRVRALGGQPDGWRLGLGVLQQRGVAAWLRLRQATVPTTSPPPPARAALPIGAGCGGRAGRAAGLDGAGRRRRGGERV